MKKLVPLILSSVALIAPIRAMASDFSFQVPVNLTNLHSDITQGKIRCVASSNESAPWAGGYAQIGVGEQSFPIAGGRYVGTINIAFDAAPTANPASARVWACNMLLFATAQGWRPAALMVGGGPRPPFERDRSVPIHTEEQGRIR